MELLVVRHAPAGNRLRWALQSSDDSARPITPAGRHKMKLAARGIAKLVDDIDLIVASPYARAEQTADVLAARFPGSKRLSSNALAPHGDPANLLDWLGQCAESCIALVGHEPYLGALVGLLVSGKPRRLVLLRKGAAALIRFDGAPARSRGTLQWLHQPSELRRLA